MRVLHLISSGGMYGAEAVILDLCRAFRRAGDEGVIGIFANSAHPNTELQSRAAQEGIRTVLIPCAGQLDRAVPARVLDAARQTGANVVHSHGYKADVYARWALRGSPLPLVATCHTWTSGGLALRLYSTLDRLVLRSFSAVVAVSDEIQQQLFQVGIRRGRTRMIRNGVDLHALTAIPRPRSPLGPGQSLRVGMAARLTPQKGIDLLIRAAADVRKTVPNAQFVVAGEGPDRASLEALVEQLELGDHFQLIGRADDMPGFYASLDLLVLPSRYEGLPMTLLEGMASGLPAVATTVGEMPSVVEDGLSGLLIPPEDPTALAEAIAGVLLDESKRLAMGAAARQRVIDAFSADRMAEEYLEVYEAVQPGRALAA